MRRLFNLFPPIRNSGVKITRISSDWCHWELRLPLNLKTRNYVGTHYGGTLYSAADPHYMLAWMHILGPDYIVWDKAASIRFRRPGRSTLTSRIDITEDEVEEVKRLCATQPKVDRTYQMKWLDLDGTVVAQIEKVVHFRRAEA